MQAFVDRWLPPQQNSRDRRLLFFDHDLESIVFVKLDLDYILHIINSEFGLPVLIDPWVCTNLFDLFQKCHFKLVGHIVHL